VCERGLPRHNQEGETDSPMGGTVCERGLPGHNQEDIRLEAPRDRRMKRLWTQVIDKCVCSIFMSVI
jgi:hypothetical protein